MKVIVYILAVLVASALAIGAGFLIVVNSPDGEVGLVMLATFASTIFIYGPLSLGSVTAYWDTKKSGESKRYFRWWYRILIALEVLAAIAIVVYAVLAQAPVWLPVLFIVGGAVLSAAAIAVGTSLRRHEEKHPRPAEPWLAVSPRDIARKITKVVVTFVAALVLGFLVLVIVGRDYLVSETMSAAAFAVGISFFAASFACMLVTMPLLRRVRESVSRDAGLVRRLAKVVLKGKPLELSPNEQVVAARYAAIIRVIMPFQLAYILLLYIGLGLQQVQMLTLESLGIFPIVTFVLFLVILVVIVPLYVRYTRRARAYATEHVALLASGEGGPAVAPSDS